MFLLYMQNVYRGLKSNVMTYLPIKFSSSAEYNTSRFSKQLNRRNHYMRMYKKFVRVNVNEFTS